MNDNGEAKAKGHNDLESLAARAREGDRAACRELYERHKSGVFTLVLRLCGDRAEAEDITQESFIKAFRGLAGYRGEASFSTWLYRIAVNCWRSWMRSRKRVRQLPLDRVEIASGATQRRSDLRLLLERAVARLPEGCREVFVLHDVQGMGHAEIAGILGCSEGNARSQLWKARGKLRDLIAPQLESESIYEVQELDAEAAEPAG